MIRVTKEVDEGYKRSYTVTLHMECDTDEEMIGLIDASMDKDITNAIVDIAEKAFKKHHKDREYKTEAEE